MFFLFNFHSRVIPFTLGLLSIIGAQMAFSHTSIAANTVQSPSAVEITTLLDNWYRGWDRVFENKQNPEVCDALSQFMVEKNGMVALPSSTATRRSELLAFLQQLQKSDIQDHHTLEGFKILDQMRVQAFVHFIRSVPVKVELHTRVEIEFAYEGDGLRIKSYKPAFSMAEPAIRTMMDSYLLAFQELNIEKTSQFYTLPIAILTPSGVVTFQTDEQVRGFLSNVFAQLRTQNYARSTWKELHVFPLGPTTAFISAVLERHDSNGNMIERSGANYQVILKDGKRQIAVGGANPSDFVIR